MAKMTGNNNQTLDEITPSTRMKKWIRIGKLKEKNILGKTYKESRLKYDPCRWWGSSLR